MDQVERQVTSFNVNEKKLGSMINDESTVEILSNEIFYEIFEYLDGFDIYKGFFNLNSRFQQLVSSSTLLLNLSLNQKSELDIKSRCLDVIIPNKYRIISLHLSNSKHIKEFLKYCPIDETFHRLESLKLIGLSIFDLIPILYYLRSLPHLLVLTIALHNYPHLSTDLNEPYQLTSGLPILTSNFMIDAEYELYLSALTSLNARLNTVEYLIMKETCSLKELILILHLTPRLHHLICQGLSESSDNFPNETSMMVPNLRYLSIWYCSIKFAQFERFIKKICSGLKALHIRKFVNSNYIEPDRWQQLILQNMPRLQRFNLKCSASFGYDFTDPDYNSFVRQLTSQFWFERGWLIGLEIQLENLFYSIHSKRYFRRKFWFNFDKTMKENISYNMTQSNLHSTPIYMLITNYPIGRICLPVLSELSPIFLGIEFTYLHISFSNLPITTLVKILDLLPNLDSLKISFSSIQNLNNLPDQIEKSFRLTSLRNRITRVWLTMEFTLMDVLMKLCPSIEHIEFDNVDKKDFMKLTRIILLRSMKDIPHLYSICFHVKNTNHEMIDDMKKMIDSEKLLSDYNIRRQCNDILLQWK